MKISQSQHDLYFRVGLIAGRIVGAVLVLLVIVMAVGALARANLKAKYPPPGQMVDVGGYRLHINCMGKGSPTVILDAGNGESSLDWALVQPEVVRSTRVCAYDRAGYGWSDPSPLSRTPQSNVKELHALLKGFAIEGPYVLVAHSYGGLVTRLYAHTYPGDVVGMVLVDTPSDDLLARLPRNGKDVFLRSVAQGAQQAQLGETLERIGVLPLFPSIYPIQANVPTEIARIQRALAASDESVFDAYAGELAAYDVSFAQMQAAHITSFGDIPLRVLSRGKPQAGFGPEAEKVWQQLQVEMVALSSNGKRIVAEKSGHFIQLDQPDLVIDAIQDVLATIKK